MNENKTLPKAWGEIDKKVSKNGDTMTGVLDFKDSAYPLIRNSNDESGIMWIDFINDIATVRYGGNGVGSSNGFQVCGTGNVVKLKVDDSGELYAKGNQKVYHTQNKPPITDSTNNNSSEIYASAKSVKLTNDKIDNIPYDTIRYVKDNDDLNLIKPSDLGRTLRYIITNSGYTVKNFPKQLGSARAGYVDMVMFGGNREVLQTYVAYKDNYGNTVPRTFTRTVNSDGTSQIDWIENSSGYQYKGLVDDAVPETLVLLDFVNALKKYGAYTADIGGGIKYLEQLKPALPNNIKQALNKYQLISERPTLMVTPTYDNLISSYKVEIFYSNSGCKLEYKGGSGGRWILSMQGNQHTQNINLINTRGKTVSLNFNPNMYDYFIMKIEELDPTLSANDRGVMYYYFTVDSLNQRNLVRLSPRRNDVGDITIDVVQDFVMSNDRITFSQYNGETEKVVSITACRYNNIIKGV